MEGLRACLPEEVRDSSQGKQLLCAAEQSLRDLRGLVESVAPTQTRAPDDDDGEYDPD